MEEDLNFFFNNNVSQPKKKIRDKKNKIVQRNKNKIMKFSDQHILQRTERKGFVWQKLCFEHLCSDDKKYEPIFFGEKNF